MNILAECYNDDKRKSYHAITFADQAIRYYSKYADAAALAYISTALKWLEEEQLQSPWNKSIDRLLKQLRHVR